MVTGVCKVKKHVSNMSKEEWKEGMFELQEGKCVYCNCDMVLTDFNTLSKNKRKTIGKRLATIEHIYSRYDLRRFTKEGASRKVLACKTCNNKRSQIENRQFSDFAKEQKEYKGILFLLLRRCRYKEDFFVIDNQIIFN